MNNLKASSITTNVFAISSCILLNMVVLLGLMKDSSTFLSEVFWMIVIMLGVESLTLTSSYLTFERLFNSNPDYKLNSEKKRKLITVSLLLCFLTWGVVISYFFKAGWERGEYLHYLLLLLLWIGSGLYNYLLRGLDRRKVKEQSIIHYSLLGVVGHVFNLKRV